MGKTLSGLNFIDATVLGEDDLIEISHKNGSTFESFSTTISELRKKMVAATDIQRVVFSGNHFLSGSHVNKTFQIQIPKAYIPWHTDKTDLYISTFLAKFNISGTVVGTVTGGTIDHTVLFSDCSVSYHNSLFKKHFKYIPSYYDSSNVTMSIQNYDTEPDIPVSMNSFTLKVVGVAETLNDLIFTVSIVNGTENGTPYVYTDSTVKFEGYVDISATYDVEPTMLTLLAEENGEVKIKGFDIGTEINWGDGNVTTVSDQNFEYIHLYGNIGQSVLKISMNAPMSSGGNITLIGDFSEIMDWGSYNYSKPVSFRSTKLTTVPTVEPPTSNYSYLFQNCTIFNQDLSTWNTTSVTNMNGAFKGCWQFDNDVTTWDTSNVNSMYEMFHGCENFNQDISGWNVDNIVNTASMFYGAQSFNQDLNNWNVSNVTNMSGMFEAASSFNGNITDWNPINVRNMTTMFNNAIMFNQDLTNWCVPQITDEPILFASPALSPANHPIWGTCPSDTSMKLMIDYKNTEKSFLTQTPLSISNLPLNSRIEWGDGDVTIVDSAGPFIHTYAPDTVTMCKIYFAISNPWEFGVFKISSTNEILNWSLGGNGLEYAPVTQIIDFGNFNGDSIIFRKLNIQHVPKNLPPSITSTQKMFEGNIFAANIIDAINATALNIASWNVKNVTDMSYMFHKSLGRFGDITGWNVKNVTNMEYMFYEMNDIGGIIPSFYPNLSNWCVELILSEPTNFGHSSWPPAKKPHWGEMCSLMSFGIGGIGASYTIAINGLPEGSTIIWGDGATDVIGTGVIFIDHTYVAIPYAPDFALKISLNEDKPYQHNGGIKIVGPVHHIWNWGDYAGNTFEIQSQELETVPNWVPSSITNMSNMFSSCTKLDDWDSIHTWDFGNVVNMQEMFANCSALSNSDLAGINLKNVTTMEGMFEGCASLLGVYVGGEFDNLTTMSRMFKDCTSLSTVQISMDAFILEDTTSMFYGCTNLEDVIFISSPSPDPSHVFPVKHMSSMFFNCNSLQHIALPIISTDTENVSSMFGNCHVLENIGGMDIWNVSSVINMDGMFENCYAFNMDLSSWCVEQIATEPSNFSLNATVWTLPKPNWGAPCVGFMTGLSSLNEKQSTKTNNVVKKEVTEKKKKKTSARKASKADEKPTPKKRGRKKKSEI